MKDKLYKYIPVKEVDLSKLEDEERYVVLFFNNRITKLTGYSIKTYGLNDLAHILLPVEDKSEAIEFAEWINLNMLQFVPNENKWFYDFKIVTTEELYNIFKKEQNENYSN